MPVTRAFPTKKGDGLKSGEKRKIFHGESQSKMKEEKIIKSQ